MCSDSKKKQLVDDGARWVDACVEMLALDHLLKLFVYTIDGQRDGERDNLTLLYKVCFSLL